MRTAPWLVKIVHFDMISSRRLPACPSQPNFHRYATYSHLRERLLFTKISLEKDLPAGYVRDALPAYSATSVMKKARPYPHVLTPLKTRPVVSKVAMER